MKKDHHDYLIRLRDAFAEAKIIRLSSVDAASEDAYGIFMTAKLRDALVAELTKILDKEPSYKGGGNIILPNLLGTN